MVAARRTVLVTGATGYIAGQLLPYPRERFDLRLTDVRPTGRDGRPTEGLRTVDLLGLPLETLRPLFRGCAAVVHLAYYRRLLAAPQWSIPSDYEEERINVDLAQRIYQLSLEEGVERVVVASSNHATDWYEHLLRDGRMDIVDPELTPPRSDNFYGWSKASYEHLGFVYAAGGGGARPLANVQIRIGAPREIEAKAFFPDGPGTPGDAVRYRRDLGAYVSPRDLAQLVVRSIEAPSIDDGYGIAFQIFYAISGNTRAFWSIVNARRVIGYQPQDDSEVRFADEIRAYLVDPARAQGS